MSRFDEKPNAPVTPLNSFFNSDRKVGKGLATYGDLDHGVLDQHATIEDVDGDATAVTEVVSDSDTLFAVARSHWGIDNPNLADEMATSGPMMDRVSVSTVAMDAVSVSTVAMDAVSVSTVAMDAVSVSTVAMDAVSVSTVAMDAVSVSDIALDAIWASAVAWDIVKAKSMAVGKFAVGRAGLDGADYADIDAVAASQTAMDAVSTSQTAMDAVSTSQTAMDAVSTSQTAMDAVSTSQTAMDAVSTSATGMEAVATSQLAMDAVVAATNVALPTVVETVTAMNEVSLSDLALDTLWASTAAWDLIKANSMSVGKFVVGRAGLSGYDYADIGAVAGSQTAMDAVSTSQTAMDAVSTSQTAMDAVSTSQTAMDAVSTSSTALDSIWNSQLAWDTVKTKAMAVGKFVVGRAGLDGANYADIDAVVASQSAMDAVAASIDARSAVFESDYALASLWATLPGAKTILKTGGTPTLPHTYDGDRLAVRIEDGSGQTLPGDAKTALELATENADSGVSTRDGLTLSLDLSNAATMEFQQRANNVNDANIEHGVSIDGTIVFSTGGNNAWTNRSIDVSGYNGTHDVKFWQYNTWGSGQSYQAYFTDLNLI